MQKEPVVSFHYLPWCWLMRSIPPTTITTSIKPTGPAGLTVHHVSSHLIDYHNLTNHSRWPLFSPNGSRRRLSEQKLQLRPNVFDTHTSPKLWVELSSIQSAGPCARCVPWRVTDTMRWRSLSSVLPSQEALSLWLSSCQYVVDLIFWFPMESEVSCGYLVFGMMICQKSPSYLHTHFIIIIIIISPAYSLATTSTPPHEHYTFSIL